MVAVLAHREATRIRELTREANQLERDFTQRVTQLVPSPLNNPGCGALSAGKLIGQAADISRLKSRDAYAMRAGGFPQSRCGQPPRNVSASTAAETAKPTLRSTASPSPNSVSTPTPKPSSNGASKPHQPNAKPSDSSNANSPTSSTEPPKRHPTTRTPPRGLTWENHTCATRPDARARP